MQERKPNPLILGSTKVKDTKRFLTQLQSEAFTSSQQKTKFNLGLIDLNNSSVLSASSQIMC